MIANLILTITNFIALYPMSIAYRSRDWLTFVLLLFVTMASVSSHCVENYRHTFTGMITVSQSTAIALNDVDKILCIPILLRMMWIVGRMLRYDRGLFTHLIILIILSLLLNIISSLSRIPPWLFVVLHSTWHIMIFYTMGRILSIYHSILFRG
jgi:hypothetical protein